MFSFARRNPAQVAMALIALIVPLSLVALATPAGAAPVNDNFINATMIPHPGMVTGDNIGATLEPGEPNSRQNFRSVWWRFTPPVTGEYMIDTRQSGLLNIFEVYTGTAVNALTLVESSRNNGWATVQLNAGMTYSIRVAEWWIPSEGSIVLLLLGPSPANDHFANAVTISGFRTVTGNNTGASFELREPDRPRNSVWWKFRAPTTGPLRINTFGSNFDTVLEVTTGTRLNALTHIGSNDDTEGGLQSELVFTAYAGWDYNISVRGYAMTSGFISLTVGPGGTGAAKVVAAITPVARPTTVGTPVTAYATILNAGTSTATGCRPQRPSGTPTTFSYRPRSPAGVLGTVNGPANIPAGGRQDFLMTLRPRAAATTNIPLIFDCTNTDPAPSLAGLNTFLLTAVTGTAPADMIATTATLAGGGIMNIPLRGTGFASIAAKNIGAAATMQLRLSASAIGAPAATLPVTMTVCRSNPTTGACLSPPAAPPINFSAAAGTTVTFSAFLRSNGTVIPFDPARKRLFMNFYQGANAVGSTSVAVRTVAAGGGAALVASK